MSDSAAPGFRILGRRLDVSGLPALRDWLRSHWHFAEHDLAPHPYTIRVDAADTLPPPDGVTPHVASIPGYELTWLHRDGVWQTRAGDTVTRLRLEPDGARITLAPVDGDTADPSGDRTPAARAALYTALGEAVRASGLLPIHGAAIARGDDATLLLGPSGTGKTTTLLRAVRAGWSPVAEDLVWLDIDALRVHGWDRGVRLWPGTVRDLVAGVAEADWDRAPDGKLFLPWERIPAPRTPSARLRRVVRLERTGDVDDASRDVDDASRDVDDASRDALSPIAAPEIVRVLWEAAGVPLADAARAFQAAAILRLAREVEHLRLRLDSRPGDLDVLDPSA